MEVGIRIKKMYWASMKYGPQNGLYKLNRLVANMDVFVLTLKKINYMLKNLEFKKKFEPICVCLLSKEINFKYCICFCKKKKKKFICYLLVFGNTINWQT